MANTGDSYIITLSKSHLEWGTHRYTSSRGKVYGEGYIPIPARIARNFDLLNNNGTNKQAVLGKNIFNCASSDGLFHTTLRSQGCSKHGNIHAKQFSGNKNLKAIGSWYSQLNAQVGDQVRVTFTSPTDIVIERI